jgi:hypothetical protein
MHTDQSNACRSAGRREWPYRLMRDALLYIVVTSLRVAHVKLRPLICPREPVSVYHEAGKTSSIIPLWLIVQLPEIPDPITVHVQSPPGPISSSRKRLEAAVPGRWSQRHARDHRSIRIST